MDVNILENILLDFWRKNCKIRTLSPGGQMEGSDCPPDIQKMTQTIEYVSQNYNNSLSLRAVASLMHMHRNSLSRLWHKHMKVSFTDYVNKLRIEEAKRLLHNGNYHYIKQVAYKVGLRPRYFSTLFKQKVGVTPSEYRRKYINDSV